MRCLLTGCNNKSIVENSKINWKPPKNDQRGAAQEDIL